MPALSYSITISDEESAYLKSLIKTRTIQAQVVDRARILLWKSEAKTDKAIADGLGISVNTVRRCIDRYLNGGINLAIFDNDRLAGQVFNPRQRFEQQLRGCFVGFARATIACEFHNLPRLSYRYHAVLRCPQCGKMRSVPGI